VPAAWAAPLSKVEVSEAVDVPKVAFGTLISKEASAAWRSSGASLPEASPPAPPAPCAPAPAAWPALLSKVEVSGAVDVPKVASWRSSGASLPESSPPAAPAPCAPVPAAWAAPLSKVEVSEAVDVPKVAFGTLISKEASAAWRSSGASLPEASPPAPPAPCAPAPAAWPAPLSKVESSGAVDVPKVASGKLVSKEASAACAGFEANGASGRLRKLVPKLTSKLAPEEASVTLVPKVAAPMLVASNSAMFVPSHSRDASSSGVAAAASSADGGSDGATLACAAAAVRSLARPSAAARRSDVGAAVPEAARAGASSTPRGGSCMGADAERGAENWSSSPASPLGGCCPLRSVAAAAAASSVVGTCAAAASSNWWYSKRSISPPRTGSKRAL